MNDRRVLLEKAKLAEVAGRWEDVVQCMNAVVKQGRDLSVEERNLLANAYKNHVGAKRAAWRIIMSIEQNMDGVSRRKELSKEFRNTIEDEMKVVCNELITLIDRYLLNTIDVENLIFYQKLKGDYYRYLAEFSGDTDSSDVFDNAKIAYARAYELSREHLSAGNPLRLALILNFSVFYFEILESHEMACDMVKESISVGEEDLHNQAESVRNDSAMVIQILKDNLKLWLAEMDSGIVGNKTHIRHY